VSLDLPGREFAARTRFGQGLAQPRLQYFVDGDAKAGTLYRGDQQCPIFNTDYT